MNKNINSYTYLIGWSKLNKYYYGVRTAKNCNPKELFVSYFTSSKYVKKFIKQFGNPDIIQIRKTFNDKLKALEWEEKVINRLNMVFRDDFLNCGNGGKLFNSIGRTTVINKKTGEQYSISCEEYYNNKELYENAFAGNRNHWYGKPLPDDSKEKQRSAAKNRKRVACEYCQLELDISNYNRWHGEKCKNKS